MIAVVNLSGVGLLIIVLLVAIVSFVAGVSWAVNEQLNRAIASGELPDFRRRQLERLAIEEHPAEVRVLRPQAPLFDFDEGA